MSNLHNRISKRKQLIPYLRLTENTNWDEPNQLENKSPINKNQISTQDENGDFRANLNVMY